MGREWMDIFRKDIEQVTYRIILVLNENLKNLEPALVFYNFIP